MAASEDTVKLACVRAIFYNIGIHSAVETSDNAIPTQLLTTQIGDNCVPSYLVNEAAALRISMAEEFNHPLRPDKCFILSDVPLTNPIFRVEKRCAKILGVPIGFKYGNVDHPAIATRLLLEKKINSISVALRSTSLRISYFTICYQPTCELSITFMCFEFV
jgi:hypothetical protein